MGRVKDLLFDFGDIEREFVEFVSRTLQFEDYEIEARAERWVPPARSSFPDLIVRSKKDAIKIVVEVRIYLSEMVSMILLRNSVERLSRQLVLQNAARGLLVLTALLPMIVLNNMLPRFENIEIWDLVELTKKMHAHPQLLDRFNALRGAMQIGTLESPNIPAAIKIMENDPFPWDDQPMAC